VKTKQVIHNQVAYFPTQHIFQVGRKYDLRVSGTQEKWMVLGILNLAEGDDLWDNVLLINRAGDELWVSCSEGEIYAHREIEHPSFAGLLDSPSEIRGRTQLEYQDVKFSRDSEGVAYIRGMTGAFTEELRLKDKVGYWEGYDPDDEDCLSVTWDEGESGDQEPQVTWTYGTWVDPSRFKRENRVSPKASAGSPGSTRGILVVGIIAMIYLMTGADGNVHHSGYLKPIGPANVHNELKYRSKSMWFTKGDVIDVDITPSESLYPLRLSARLISAKMPTSSKLGNEPSDSKTNQPKTPAPIPLTESTTLLSGSSQPRLLKPDVIVETHAQVKESDYYVIELKAKSEKVASSAERSPAQSLPLSSTPVSSTSKTSTDVDQSMTYMIIKGAYEPSWLVWGIIGFVLLLIGPINRWFFGSLNKLFRLG
jgi:hypothetical protein